MKFDIRKTEAKHINYMTIYCGEYKSYKYIRGDKVFKLGNYRRVPNNLNGTSHPNNY